MHGATMKFVPEFQDQNTSALGVQTAQRLCILNTTAEGPSETSVNITKSRRTT